MANALFLRALVHFDLVKVYAQNYNYTTDASHLGIPIVLKIPGPNDNLKRNTVENVYAQILGDLKDADALFEGPHLMKIKLRTTLHLLLFKDYWLEYLFIWVKMKRQLCTLQKQ